MSGALKSTMPNATHPISLLTRTDANLATLFHCFFLVEFTATSKDDTTGDGHSLSPSGGSANKSMSHITADNMVIHTSYTRHIPMDRKHIKIIEEGQSPYLRDAAIKCLSLEKGEEAFGSYCLSLATAEGDRYFATWRGSNDGKIFVAVTRFSVRSYHKICAHLINKNKKKSIIYSGTNFCHLANINNSISTTFLFYFFNHTDSLIYPQSI